MLSVWFREFFGVKHIHFAVQPLPASYLEFFLSSQTETSLKNDSLLSPG